MSQVTWYITNQLTPYSVALWPEDQARKGLKLHKNKDRNTSYSLPQKDLVAYRVTAELPSPSLNLITGTSPLPGTQRRGLQIRHQTAGRLCHSSSCNLGSTTAISKVNDLDIKLEMIAIFASPTSELVATTASTGMNSVLVP